MSRKDRELPKRKMNAYVMACTAALALLLAVGALLFFLLPPAAAKDVRTIPLQNADELKIAVLSDSLLGKKPDADNPYLGNLKSAFAQLKQQNVSLILFAGDLAASANSDSYALFNKTLADAYAGEEAPPVIAALGAGELKGALTNALAQRALLKHLEQRPCARAEIGGVQVIAVGADQTKASEPYSAKALRWLEDELTVAAKEAHGRPILVLTPQPPANTICGSDTLGSAKLDAILSKYTNVISVSGGTHRAQLDERMIFQGAYTAIGSQGLSYLALESGYFDPQQGAEGLENIARPQQADARPFALILAFGHNKLTVERWNVVDQQQEKADSPWSVFLPLASETFIYSAQRRAAVNGAPYFSTQDIFAVDDIPGGNGKQLDGVAFTAAADDQRVAAYEIEAVNRLGITLTRRYVADTFLGAGAAAKVALALDPTLPGGEYTVRVFAVDDFGRRSTGFLECALTHVQQGS